MKRARLLERLRGKRPKDFVRVAKRAVRATLARARRPEAGLPAELAAWLDQGRALLAQGEQWYRLDPAHDRPQADQPGDGQHDWERQHSEVQGRLEPVRRRAAECLQRLQRLLGAMEASGQRVAKDLFSHLQRATTHSLKLQLRALPSGSLQEAALRQFLAWKDVAMREAVEDMAVAWGRPLDRSAGFGRGMDSRIVEIPLAFEQGELARPGRVLDAGCALNHAFMHELMPAGGARVTHVTQSADKEPALFASDRFSYVFGDLRSLDFRDGAFDRVLCISTLEHVGCDNTRYYAAGGKEDRQESYLDALREMLRVLRPGGTLLVTFPFGPYEHRGWYQVFGPGEIARMQQEFASHEVEAKYYFSDGHWYEGPQSIAATMPNETIEDAVAALRVTKRA
jgi:SAM-dependent methyltransferase